MKIFFLILFRRRKQRRLFQIWRKRFSKTTSTIQTENRTRWKQREKPTTISRTGKFLQQIRSNLLNNYLAPKKQNAQKTILLVVFFPGEYYEIKQDIQNIFEAEYKKACLTSQNFKECFSNAHIGAVFNNEKNLGALISKSKL